MSSQTDCGTFKNILKKNEILSKKLVFRIKNGRDML